MKTQCKSLLTAFTVAAVACSPTSEMSEAIPQSSILETMVSVITPTTNTIWDAYELQTDAQWQAVDDAAVKTIQAFEAMKIGGTGENDNRWVADPRWGTYSDQVISAAEMVREAVVKRDEDLLAEAGEKLYTPCESCHVEFQPGGADQ